MLMGGEAIQKCEGKSGIWRDSGRNINLEKQIEDGKGSEGRANLEG